MLNIEVIYATPQQQKLIELAVKPGTTIEQAIEQSGIMIQYPEIDLSDNKVGIFSQVKPLDYVLKSGDRVEIYRPLIADPKAKRREKAEQNKSK
ncbi:MAG: RnfH family protein [Marinicella pacifica]